MADTPSLSQLVVIGSSAGGIEALSILLSNVPPALSVPIVIAQHLDPRRPSHLAEILAPRSPLPVRVVEDREKLVGGTVYVVPTNRDVEITDHEIILQEGTRAVAKPSIDLLFTSAAEAFGEALVAVILTGTGSDGAEGARAVKNAGGTVIIQNPETASFPSMPLSLAPTTVDIVANLEAIGPILRDLSTGAMTAPRAEVDRHLRAFLENLREQSGIDFGSYKLPTIMRRLQRRIAATGTENLSNYIRFLQRNPDEYQRLVNSFLIKVTEFFRDPELFSYLRDELLPQLIREAEGSKELRIWSAGCATGEEAYSLAILVSELLSQNTDMGVSVRIFATDLDGEAISFARRGVYPASALSEMPPDMIERYFTPLNGAFEVNKVVRGMVVFGQHDLGQRAPFPRIDMALCRNVLIYFTTELQRRALQLFAFSLRDGGYLVLGKAETVTPLADFFALEQPRLKVYRRVGDRVLIPPARIKDSVPTPQRQTPQRRWVGTDSSLARLQREMQRARSGTERAEGLIQRLPVGVVVLDRRYDIVTINNTARRLLGIHTSAIGEDFIHLVQHVPLTPLRNCVELRSANEELLISGEETQAATEEIETLNEELQATNEELETLNEELQATVEELNTTNDDLQARSTELQDLTIRLENQRRTSETERMRLAAILTSIGDAVLVVGRDGRAALTNAAYQTMFGGGELVPLDEQGQALSAEQTPQQRAARGEAFNTEFTMRGEDGSLRYFEANGQPVRDPQSNVEWGVVVIRDITDRSLRRLQDQFLALASHELRTPLTSLRANLGALTRQLEGIEVDGRVRQQVNGAMKAAMELNALVDDLSDITRVQSDKLRLNAEPLDLRRVVMDAVETMTPLTTGQTIRLRKPRQPVPVVGDALRLRQIVANLIANAINYAPNTETIDVSLRQVEKEAELKVQDHGAGIAPEALPHVFSRYYQVTRQGADQTGGLGLGLYLVKQLTEAHGGTVAVASKAGKGTTFTVRLPLHGASSIEPGT
ncbi:MAG: CheR family methyltransferase [Anaerolineae bacterium]